MNTDFFIRENPCGSVSKCALSVNQNAARSLRQLADYAPDPAVWLVVELLRLGEYQHVLDEKQSVLTLSYTWPGRAEPAAQKKSVCYLLVQHCNTATLTPCASFENRDLM